MQTKDLEAVLADNQIVGTIETVGLDSKKLRCGDIIVNYDYCGYGFNIPFSVSTYRYRVKHGGKFIYLSNFINNNYPYPYLLAISLNNKNLSIFKKFVTENKITNPDKLDENQVASLMTKTKIVAITSAYARVIRNVGNKSLQNCLSGNFAII